MSSLRPLQLVDGPTSPGPSSAPYSSLVSPPPSASRPRLDKRLSLQLQSSQVPATPISPTPAQLKRHSSQIQSSEHRVLTLAERHADLLRFIAQKESKCLELRQQLAQHEADLLALKRKWERIVSRGNAGASTSSMPSPPASNRDSLDFMTLGGGIKDGVGRMLSGLALGDMFPSHAQASDTAASPSVVTSTAKADSYRSSLSGSSNSTVLSEADHEDEDEQDNRDSTVTTPSEELLVDLSSPVESTQPPPPGPKYHKQPPARPSRMTIAIGHAHSPSLTSPPPVPLHSAALANIVPMVNRKWEELKGTETLQRSQKRASAILNDVYAALVPPTPDAVPAQAERRRASENSGASSRLSSPASRSSSSNSQATSVPSVKLHQGPAPSRRKTTPSSSSTPSGSAASPLQTSRDKYLDDDWNW